MAAPIKLPKVLGGATLLMVAAMAAGTLLGWITAQALPFQKRINTG